MDLEESLWSLLLSAIRFLPDGFMGSVSHDSHLILGARLINAIIASLTINYHLILLKKMKLHFRFLIRK